MEEASENIKQMEEWNERRGNTKATQLHGAIVDISAQMNTPYSLDRLDVAKWLFECYFERP